MHLSAVPPPDARSPCWCGDHAIALTAAVCSVNRNTGCCDRWFHTNNWLSFPPEASSRSSCDHLSPQTWQLRSHKGLRSKTLRQDAFLFCTVTEIFARTLFMLWKSHLWSMTTKLADIVTGDADVMLQYVLVPATWGQDAWAPCQYSSPCLVTSHISNPFTARTVPNLFKYQSYLYVNTSYPWNIQTPPKSLKFAMKSGTFESGV